MLNLITNASKNLHAVAIVSNQREVSYQQLLNDSQVIATHLLGQSRDLAENRIAFMVDPSYEYVAVQWGIWRAGGIAVPLCTAHPLPSLAYVLEDTQASKLIVAKEYAEMLWESAEKYDIELLHLEDVMQFEEEKKLPEVDTDRVAMILYTSGTTSKPKGVVITHANIEFQAATLSEAWGWQSTDYILNVLPLHHVHGIVNILTCALWNGATCEFLPKFDAETVWNKFLEGKINVFMAVPTIYNRLITYWEEADQEAKAQLSASLTPFRLMVSGSAALPVPVLEKWKAISGHTLLERYGMTEIGMALSNPYEGERRPGHVGQALPKVHIRLQKEDGTLATGEESGEIQIKGPNVFKEYWKKPAATQSAFTADGWFKSGDIAQLNQGAYRILGRNSVDIIKSGGYKISALEIEDKLRQHESIVACAVVGIPDENWGEAVAVGVVLREGQQLALKAMRTWAKEHLPAYKIPSKLLVLKELPRNTLGKVTKKELKKLFIA
ncbi:MAG: acyl-CoA synthetase [Flammeovirgaceae bacterium]